MCVWHSKNCGRIHIPLSGLPQNTAKRTPRNQSPPSSRNNTNKMIKILKMYRKTSHLEVQLDLHLCPFSHLFPESEPKCPTGSAGLARSSKKLPKWRARVSKYCPRGHQNGARGCPNTARGSRKYVPRCTFFQKVSQSAPRSRRAGPELQKAMKMKPTGIKIRAPAHLLYIAYRWPIDCLLLALDAPR